MSHLQYFVQTTAERIVWSVFFLWIFVSKVIFCTAQMSMPSNRHQGQLPPQNHSWRPSLLRLMRFQYFPSNKLNPFRSIPTLTCAYSLLEALNPIFTCTCFRIGYLSYIFLIEYPGLMWLSYVWWLRSQTEVAEAGGEKK